MVYETIEVWELPVYCVAEFPVHVGQSLDSPSSCKFPKVAKKEPINVMWFQICVGQDPFVFQENKSY